MERIIGRESEIRALTEIAGSGRPEFVAVYGRRRVGKTFLVRSAFKDKFVFYATGIIEGTYEQELEAFNIGLERYGWKGDKATNWMSAFKMLTELLKSKCSRRTTRQVVFLDELPCFDTQGSGFIKALDFFWNGSASWMDNIMNPDRQWTQVVLITTKGLKCNTHSSVAQKELTLDDLF